MNKLFYGDNLSILRRFIRDETVDLYYIDPPFNSKRNYNQIYNNIGEDRAQAQAFIDPWTWDDHANVSKRGIFETERPASPATCDQLIKDLLDGGRVDVVVMLRPRLRVSVSSSLASPQLCSMLLDHRRS